jgi:uncharacterized protein
LEDGSLRIESVVPEGSGKVAGIQVGDTLLRLNGAPMSATPSPLNAVLAGQAITYTIKRGARTKDLRTKALARPNEAAADLTYTYGAVPFANGLLRSIVSRPAGSTGRKPAVLFIQGYTCSPACDLQDWHPYRKLTDELSRQGYITMRVEKPGIGDSRGDLKCEDIDLRQEAQAFKSALIALRALPDVDTEHVFIYGHSLGGIIAPMIAQEVPLFGIATYGTTHIPWFEYFFQMLRTQGTYSGADPLELEQHMRSYHSLLHTLMVEHKTPEQAAAQDTAWASLLRSDFQWTGGRRLYGRDIGMYWDLNTVNLSEAWHSITAHVLSMYGTADIEVMGPDPAKQITLIVNHGHPGHGTFLLLDGMNHSFAQVGSMEEEYKISGTPEYWPVLKTKYDGRIASSFVEWAQKLGN